MGCAVVDNVAAPFRFVDQLGVTVAQYGLYLTLWGAGALLARRRQRPVRSRHRRHRRHRRGAHAAARARRVRIRGIGNGLSNVGQNDLISRRTGPEQAGRAFAAATALIQLAIGAGTAAASPLVRRLLQTNGALVPAGRLTLIPAIAALALAARGPRPGGPPSSHTSSHHSHYVSSWHGRGRACTKGMEVRTMPVALALAAALVFGASDFAAGLASRRFSSGSVTGVAQALGLVIAIVAVLFVPGGGPSTTALGWGALSGLGSAVGLMSLFHGLSVARFSVVATVSAVLVAVIPALVGLALGDHLSTPAMVGIAIAVPAIGLVSWQRDSADHGAARAGVLYGLLAGLGLSLLFIGLDRAGTHAGAWPLIPSQAVSLLLIAPFAGRGFGLSGKPSRVAATLAIVAGVLAGLGNLLFLAATGRGQLAVVSVVTAMYPAVAVLLARAFLDERWSRLQMVGLLTAVGAIGLVSAG